MSVPVITFFNNKGGVGKTSLVYHLSWMFAEMGHRILSADFDPQSNLSSAFLTEEQLEPLWNDDDSPNTVYKAIALLTKAGDIQKPELIEISPELFLLPGDMELSGLEGELSDNWPKSLDEKNLYRPFRMLAAPWILMQEAAQKVEASMIIVDIGPSLGAINRSILIASDYVVIPLGADLFSLQGLKNLGPTLRDWRIAWKKRLDNWKAPEFELPTGKMAPIGYLCQQYGVRLNRPVIAYDKWINKIPFIYRKYVIDEKGGEDMKPENDYHCLATIKHYRSLIPMGQEYRKPIFNLTPADGAIGSHLYAVREAYNDFKTLAKKIGEKILLS